MHKELSLALADTREIYSLADIAEARQNNAFANNEGLSAYYDKMQFAGGTRYAVKPSNTHCLDRLYETCPNFSPVIDDLKRALALALSGEEPMSFAPILLLGDAGIGKTYFARCLADCINTGYQFISMSSLTAGWILSGASAQWNHAKPGKVAQTLISGMVANPIIVLDEVDKAGGDSRYDSVGALYELLEHDTARNFRDEYVDIEIDASMILWVSTANDERSIPDPILNRMNVYQVSPPDVEQSYSIAQQLYKNIIAEHHWGFSEQASDSVLQKLAKMPPREQRRVLVLALGNAKLAGRDELMVADFEESTHAGKRQIGFH